MRIELFSDIHLEFGDYTVTPADDVDVCVVAGDLHVGLRGAPFLQHLCELYPRVLYVLGNHEFYGDELPLLYDAWRDEPMPDNFTLLQNDYEVFGPVVIAGATMWTDQVTDYAMWYLNDRKQIYGFQQNFKNEHEKTRKFFRKVIHKFENKTKVIVTHHMPIQKCISDRFKHSPMNTAFVAGDMQEIGDAVDYWLYGHTHDEADFYHNKTRYVCNPRGYIGHEFQALHYEGKVIDIKT